MGRYDCLLIIKAVMTLARGSEEGRSVNFSVIRFHAPRLTGPWIFDVSPVILELSIRSC